jgi:hypothetical protein
MGLRARPLLRFVVFPLFGIAVGLGLFWVVQEHFFHGSIRGTRAVIALSRQVLGREPTPGELAKGVELWRQSPEVLLRAVKEYERGLRQEGDYGLALVDQDGHVLSKQSGPLALVLDPFTVYANWPNQRTKRFTIDEHGFRATPRRPGKPRLVVLGGSTAFGHLLPSDASTLAWLLAQRFGDFDVINASVVGYLSAQELAQMVHRLDRLRPVAYVVLDGWNDLFDQLARHRGPAQLGFNSQFFELERRLHAYHRLTDGQSSLGDRAGGPAPPGSDEDAYLRSLRETYVANLDRMHAFATARGARLLVAFQPELGNKRFPSDAERKILATFNTWFKYLDAGIPAKYARMIREAREHCDASRIAWADPQQEPEMRDERQTLFYDPPHLNERGHALLAEILHRRLRSLLADPPRGLSPPAASP